MKIKIVYFSGTGNTRFLSEKLMEKIRKNSKWSIQNEMELISVEDGLKNMEQFEEDIILGIGYPVYDLMPPKIIKGFLDKLNNGSERRFSFVFSTYTSYPLDSNYHAIKMLQEKGFCVVEQIDFKAPGASAFFYSDPNNRFVKGNTVLDKDINKKMDEFAENILCHVNENPDNMNVKFHPMNKWHQKGSKLVFGNLFYRNLKVDSNCINCGICVKNCPDSNLIMENNQMKIQKANGCMACLRCVQICPKRAINFTASKRKGDYTTEIIKRIFEGMDQ